MDINVARHEEEIGSLRERFRAARLTPEDEKRYPELLEEWRRSAAKVSENKASDQRDLHVFEFVTDAQREHLAYLNEYYTSRHSVLSDLGCAVYYIDSRGVVYARWGDADLVQRLKEVGIRTASVFSEENVGYCALHRAAEQPFRTVERVGSENYLKILQPYACFARYAKGGPYEFEGANLIIAPLEEYDRKLSVIIHHLLRSEDDAYRDKYFYPLTKQRATLIEKSATLAQESFMLIDAKGQVAYTSPAFVANTGREAKVGASRAQLHEFMPELTFVLSDTAMRNPLIARSVKMQNPASGDPQYYFADCFPIIENGEMIGKKVVLRTLSQISQYAAPLHGSSLVYSFESIIGESEQLCACKALAYQAAQSKSNVLIDGESGTGKELFAQAIHRASDRKDKPFVAVNCGAIPKELVGSELFGYEEGAFTGAKRGGYVGKIEQARDGTLFLDEIGEMPLDVQVFLLRFLDSGEITRLGGKKALPLDVRVISATNRDLRDCVAHGSFRLDLYYRLNVLRITLPPLRERTGDFRALIDHFLQDLAPRLGKNVSHVTEEALGLFIGRSWPGNLRELRNVVERCVNLMPAGVEELSPAYLPADMFTEPKQAAGQHGVESSERIEKPQGDWRSVEAQTIQQLLIECKGNKKRVAEQMGISRATLYSKLRKYGIPL